MKKQVSVIAVAVVLLGSGFAQEAAPSAEDLQAMAEGTEWLGYDAK